MGAVPAAARPAHAIEKTAVRRAIALRLNRKGPTGGRLPLGERINRDVAWVGCPLFETNDRQSPGGLAAIVPNALITYAPLVEASRGSPANALVDID